MAITASALRRAIQSDVSRIAPSWAQPKDNPPPLHQAPFIPYKEPTPEITIPDPKGAVNTAAADAARYRQRLYSSSAFAQLKRHRMMTLLSQDYDPDLGIVVPDSIREVGLEQQLKDVCDRSAELYNEFLPRYGRAAEYCLTNARSSSHSPQFSSL